jgi:hypothetical protein
LVVKDASGKKKFKNSFRKDNYGKPEKLLPAITNPNAKLGLKSSFHERYLIS